MSGISISVAELLIKGIPEGMLTILALHFFTRTSIEPKKYLFLCIWYIGITYLVRELPIQLGINTMLSMLAMILLFQITYKGQLDKLAKLLAATIAIYLLIMISEALNVFLLEMMFGMDKTLELLSTGGLVKSISTIPSTVFLAMFVLIGNMLLRRLQKRKKNDGVSGS